MELVINRRGYVQALCMLFVLYLLTVMSIVNIFTQDRNNIELDPAPLAKFLQDVLLSIVDEEYDRALRLCEIALNISLPTDIWYTHRKLYRSLVEVSNLLKMTKGTLLDASTQSISLDIIYRLYIVKDELRDDVNEYLSKLSRYFIDPSTRYLMTTAIRRAIENLNIKIDLEVDKLLQVYVKGAYKGYVDVHMKLPEKVYGGEKFYVSLYVNNDIGTSKEAFVRIIVMFGHVITRALNLSIPLGTWIDVEVSTPGAEEVEAIGVNPLSITRAKIYALVMINIGNATIYGYALGNTSVIYERPSIKFYVPGYVYPGEQMLITIESQTQKQLNLSIYLDIISNETMVLSTVISPGVTNITVVLSNISLGYHRLIFIVHGIGRYITSTYTYVFAVSKPRPSMTMSISDIVVFPLTKLRVSLYVDISIPYAVTIYINNRKVIERVYVNSSRVEVEVEPPMTLLIWRYDIVTEVKPLDIVYDTSFKEGYTYVLNLPALIVIPGLLSIALATSSTKYVILSLKFAKVKLWRAVYGVEGSPSKTPSVVGGYSFRKSKLTNLYRKLILVVSKYVEPPQKSETLREFYNRFKLSAVAHAIKYLVKTFLDIYEKDLYSKHVVDEALAKNIIKRLDSIEST